MLQQACHGEFQDINLAIVGLARNCEKTIKADVQRIKAAADNAKSIIWLIVESDSSDNTVIELEKLKDELENFEFASLGVLTKKIPKRTDRIAYCRNYYANQIRTNARFSSVDYIAVVDLDDLNNKLSKKSIESCWDRHDWDVCAANQDGPYYDIWALRHKEWCPEDCWAQYRFLNKYRLDFEKNLWSSVYSKMVKIPQESEWIEVDSAFGGFAIYKKAAFDFCEYVGITETGEEFCEHVYFHQQLKSYGARIFINPKLINAAVTEHTIHLSFKNTIKRKIKYSIKKFFIKAIGSQKAKRIRGFILRRNQ